MAIAGNLKVIKLNGSEYAIVDGNLRETIANEYSATAPYAVGDYIVNDGTVYKCNTAIGTGGETWNSAHWDAVKVMDEVKSKVNTSDLPNINVGSATKLQTARKLEGVSFDGTHGTRYYGVCDTAAATPAKAVSINYPDATSTVETFTLETGARVIVKFTLGSSVDNPTLNINALGAKKILYKNAGISSTKSFAVNGVYEFVYDSTANSNSGAWLLVGDLMSSVEISLSQITDLSLVSDNTVYYGTCSTGTIASNPDNATKQVTLQTGTYFELTVGAKVRVKFTSSEDTASPLTCSLKVGNTTAKPIVWRGANSTSHTPAVSWRANSIIDFVYDGTNWCIVDNGLADTYMSYNNEVLTVWSRL